MGGSCYIPFVLANPSRLCNGLGSHMNNAVGLGAEQLELGSSPTNCSDTSVARLLIIAVSCMNDRDHVAWSKRPLNDLALGLN